MKNIENVYFSNDDLFLLNTLAYDKDVAQSIEVQTSNSTADTVGTDSSIDIPSSMYRSEFGDWSLSIISPGKTLFDYEEFDM